jgi:hypothetical protein
VKPSVLVTGVPQRAYGAYGLLPDEAFFFVSKVLSLFLSVAPFFT